MLAVAAIATVAACGGSDASQPAPMPSRTGIASSSSPASPVPSPTTPEQRVEAAVRAYFAAMDHALRTGDTTDFLAITTADCPCRKFTEGIERLFAAGTTRGASIEVDRLEIVRVSRAAATVRVTVKTGAYAVLDVHGDLQSDHPAGTDRVVVSLTNRRGWAVSGVVFLSQQDAR